MIAVGRNNFDVIRICAAVAVLVSHSYDFFHRSPEFFRALAWHDSAGGVAVKVFFVVSGFLVSGSLTSRPQLFGYLAARVLRIMPGLAVAVLFCVFVVGPIFTTLPLREYFAARETWAYLKTMLVFPMQWQLPGVFDIEPYPRSVNGSLWTLPIEAALYLTLPAVAAIGMLRRRMAFLLPIGFLASYLVATRHFGLDHDHAGPAVLSVHLFHFLASGVFFFAGVALFVYRSWIPPNVWFAALALGAFVASFRTPLFFVAEAIALPYLTYALAFCRYDLCGLTRRTGDISYGFYIYAFPVQRGVYDWAAGRLDFWPMVALSIVVTFVLASLSWRYVEQPALARKPRPVRSDPAMASVAALGLRVVGANHDPSRDVRSA